MRREYRVLTRRDVGTLRRWRSEVVARLGVVAAAACVLSADEEVLQEVTEGPLVLGVAVTASHPKGLLLSLGGWPGPAR